MASRTITTDQSYQYDYGYNSIGALDTVTYPTSPVPAGQTGPRLKLRYAYSHGVPSQITDITQPTAKTLWTLNAANDDSVATSEALGGTLLAGASGYHPWTGEMTARQAGVLPATANRENLAYQWDSVGNLTSRQDLNQALTETFTHDGLDRVVSSTLNGVSNLSVAYDAAGNVTSRSDVGAYAYAKSSKGRARYLAMIGLVIYFFRLFRRTGSRVHAFNLGFLVLYGLILAVFNSLWTFSVALNGAAVATVLAYSSPAFTALFAWRLLGERLSTLKLALL